MELKTAILTSRTSPSAKKIVEAEAAAAGMTPSKYIEQAVLRENATRAASRATLPMSHEVSSEDEKRRIFICGDAASPTCWPARDSVLASMGAEFNNQDFRAALFRELYVRDPGIAAGAYAASQLNVELCDALLAAWFDDLFRAEPEAKFDAFSISDTAKLLFAEHGNYEERLKLNGNRSELLEMHLAEAERAGVATRRSHARRVLRQWREAGIEWPKIELDNNGTPYLADGARIEFQIVPYKGGARREPRLVTVPKVETQPEPIEPSPRANQIGSSHETRQHFATRAHGSVKIGDL